MKILAANNEITCLCCLWPPSSISACICEIHQEHTEKKTGTENSDIFISGKETKYWVECPASSEIFQKIQIPITKP